MKIALPVVLRCAVPVALVFTSVGALAEAGFDCSHADGQVEQLVCKNRELTQLDRELNRTFSDASKSPSAKRHPELKAMQRGWIKGRNDCWKSTDMATCVRDSYVLRIAELRRDFPLMADAAGKMSSPPTNGMNNTMPDAMPHGTTGGMTEGMDNKGITIGPLALSCRGIAGKISVTFVNSTPGAAALTIDDQTQVLGHTMSASGARYAAKSPDGEHVLWNKGKEYRLERPGQPATLCSERVSGG